jgi:UDP-GlcNAc:undecaprenyl-phosphate GlcNAc-1-phosphate transferase
MPSLLLPVVVGGLCILIGLQRVRIANAFDLMDAPDSVRKFHGRPTPVVGGIMFLLCAVVLIGYQYAQLLVLGAGPDQRLFILAAIVLPHCILGLTDDRYSVPAAARLIYSLSLTAAVLATDRSLSIRDLHFSFDVSLRINSQLAYFLSLLFVIGFIYAVNMIDGMNGILGVYGLILTVVFAASLYPGNIAYFLAVAVGLSVFMAFNMSGLLFAGDGGSYGLGSCAAVMFLLVYTTAPSFRPFPIEMLAVSVFVPVADSIRVSLSRINRGVSPFSADRNHLHHRLQHRYGPHGALAVFAAMVGVPIAFALAVPSLTWAALILAVAIYLAVVYGVARGPAAAASA